MPSAAVTVLVADPPLICPMEGTDVQATIRALRSHAGAGDALPEGGLNLGRAYWLRPRPGQRRLMAFGCLLLSGGLAASLAWQSNQGTITPWVVEVDHLGQAQAVAPASPFYQSTDPQIAFHLARFIEDVRGLPTDAIVLRQDWLRAYDFTTDRGAAALSA